MQRNQTTPIDGNGLPNILDFLDYRQFLRLRMDAMHAENPKYSQRWFAKQAGMKSPQLISMIVSGQRRLSDELLAPLAKALKLTEREVEYLQLIVSLAHTESEEGRHQILVRIRTAFQNGLFVEMSDRGLEILRHWYLPALREIVTLGSFRADPAWIAEQLKLSEAEVRAGIELLVETGYLRVDGKTYARTEPSFRMPEKVYPILAANFQLQMLEQSFRAHAYERDRRHFECLTFAVSRRFMPQVVDAMKRFVREVDLLVESQSERDEVCQLNVQFFSLTATAARRLS